MSLQTDITALILAARAANRHAIQLMRAARDTLQSDLQAASTPAGKQAAIDNYEQLISPMKQQLRNASHQLAQDILRLVIADVEAE